MHGSTRLSFVILLTIFFLAAGNRPSAAQSLTAIEKAGRITVLVPPGGGAFELPVHPWQLCVLSFSEEMADDFMFSSKEFELLPWKESYRQMGARATVDPVSSGQTGSFALISRSGDLKVNVTLRVVPKDQRVASFVYFQTVTEEQNFEARVALEVEKVRRSLEPEIRARAEQTIIERALVKLEQIDFDSIRERNDDNVVAELEQALLLGDAGYLFFSLRNRGASAFRISRLELTSKGKPLPVEVKLYPATADKDPNVIGVVLPEKSVRGIVVIRGVNAVLKQSLTLEVAGFKGYGAFSISGIVLR